jgi:hypothetical protein
VLVLLMVTGLLRNHREEGNIWHLLSARVSLSWIYFQTSIFGLMTTTNRRVCHGFLSSLLPQSPHWYVNQGWKLFLVDVLFPGFYLLEFERCVPIHFPSSKFRTQGEADFQGVMDIVRIMYRSTDIFLGLTPFPLKITQTPARKAFFFSLSFMTFSFLSFSRHHLDLCFTHLPRKYDPQWFNQINPSRSRRCDTAREIRSSSGHGLLLRIRSNAGNWPSSRHGNPTSCK